MKNYIELPLKDYLDDLAGGDNAPGGGSACAMVAASAAALGSMVCHFTLGKKKYADVQDRIQYLLEQFEQTRGELIALIQKDVEVFQTQMGAAFEMPKDTDEQKAQRLQAIQDASKAVCQPPLEITRKCCKTLKLLVELAEKGNEQLVSDVGVAVELSASAFEGAKLNIEINFHYIKDPDFVKSVETELAPLTSGVGSLADHAKEIVRNRMNR